MNPSQISATKRSPERSGLRALRAHNPREYRDPAPSPSLIQATGRLVRWCVLTGLPVLRGPVRWLRRFRAVRKIPGFRALSRLLGGWLQIRTLDLPAEDLSRLRSTLGDGGATFLAPNHPEFFTDWMIDKEVCMRSSPLAASWADWPIVNGNRYTQKFWLRNGLIANLPGGGGKRFSEHWAHQGHGVLLHPEGGVTWNAKYITSLFPGVVDMAIGLVRRYAREKVDRPVYIAPFVSRHVFVRDVSQELHQEMETIERALALTNGAGRSVGERFGALQENLLQQRMSQHGFCTDAPGFFHRQHRFFVHLENRVVEALGRIDQDEVPRRIHAYRKANTRIFKTRDAKMYAQTKRRLDEMQRLLGFEVEHYGAQLLTQEDMAESLKRIRRDCIKKGLGNTLHNMMPLPIAERDAHIRVVEPIRVEAPVGHSVDRAARGVLLDRVRQAMQAQLDGLNESLSSRLNRHAVPNPFYDSV